MSVNALELPSQMTRNPSISLEYTALFLLQQFPQHMLSARCTELNSAMVFLACLLLAC